MLLFRYSESEIIEIPIMIISGLQRKCDHHSIGFKTLSKTVTYIIGIGVCLLKWLENPTCSWTVATFLRLKNNQLQQDLNCQVVHLDLSFCFKSRRLKKPLRGWNVSQPSQFLVFVWCSVSKVNWISQPTHTQSQISKIIGQRIHQYTCWVPYRETWRAWPHPQPWCIFKHHENLRDEYGGYWQGMHHSLPLTASLLFPIPMTPPLGVPPCGPCPLPLCPPPPPPHHDMSSNVC